MPPLDSGTTTWLLASSAMVLFMTPGLAFFYGGMSRSKNVLNMMMMMMMMMMSFSALGAWVRNTRGGVPQ